MTPPERLRDTMAAHVARGELPGLVTLVDRRGELHVDGIGTMAVGSSAPMQRDAIFRISSMSKPITAAAALLLVEEGKLRLDDPIDPLLPELAGRRVLRRIDSPLDDTVPAARAITLRDLLTFRMGFGMVWGPPDATPIQRAESALHLGALGPPHPAEPPPPDEWVRRFATLPLMHQPGERWMYNTSAEVLSVLLARAAGAPLDRFLREGLFEPLGMKDSSFFVPASKLDRLPPSYMPRTPMDPDSGQLDVYDRPDGDWSRPPAFPSGAAGLVSTVDDFHAFAKMLLARGTAGRTRILSEASVDAMTRDQLTPEQKVASEFYPPGYWSTHGWGYCLAITTGPRDPAGPGGFGWDGGLGTSWCADPKEGLVAILMTQRAAFPGTASVYRDFWTTVYGA